MGKGGSACPKGLPKVYRRSKKRNALKADLAKAYAEVDLLDGPHCRATGRYTTPGAVDPRVRREHDHLFPRSTHPELVTAITNIYVVCAEVHQLIHAGAIHVEGTDARRQLFFHWNRAMVPEGEEPFLLKNRRTVLDED